MISRTTRTTRTPGTTESTAPPAGGDAERALLRAIAERTAGHSHAALADLVRLRERIVKSGSSKAHLLPSIDGAIAAVHEWCRTGARKARALRVPAVSEMLAWIRRIDRLVISLAISVLTARHVIDLIYGRLH